MKPRILSAEQLNRLVDDLASSRILLAPAKTREWTEFRRVRSHREVDTTRVNTRAPAKSVLFPQNETVLRFDRTGASAEPEPPAETVILGVRPCDAAGLAFLEKFFCGNGPTDPYVRARRDKTTVVGLACDKPADTCFCLAVGGSPTGTKGMDLLLTDLGGRFLAEPLTPKGEALVRELPEPAPADLAKKKELADKAAAAITGRIDAGALKRKLDKGFDHAAWDSLCLPCVNCGACTFLCPTCHCFDVTDVERKGKGARVRVWDSCQFCQYSQHASGHNPRVAAQSRYRNRVMDKFKYTVDMVGEVSCVGCGRCILECPAAIDIREVVDAISKALPEK